MYTKKVQEFTSACEENLPQKPILMTEDKKDFIAKMVKDEMDELKEAHDIPSQADALVDAIYYICDTAVRHGINLDPIFDIVHKANMQKVVDGKVIRREDGKILKPKTWQDPEKYIVSEIKTQLDNGAF